MVDEVFKFPLRGLSKEELLQKIQQGRFFEAENISVEVLKKYAAVLIDVAENESMRPETKRQLMIEVSHQLDQVAYCFEHGQIGLIGEAGDG